MADLLLASRAEIEAAQAANLAEAMARIAAGHPFYRQLLAARGLGAADFRAPADLAKLPLTRKDVYLREPEAFRLSGAGLPEEMQAVWDVMYTTGSTAGRPTSGSLAPGAPARCPQ